MNWPLYFTRNLTLGSPTSSLGLCLLWTPQERVLPVLLPNSYAVAGNLYSREGISYIVRNVLARPTIRTLVLCGRDMIGSGAALVALMSQGIDEQHRVIGEGTQLHQEIPLAAIEQFRRGVRLIDARDRVRPETIAALLAEVGHVPEPFLPAPQVFPHREPTAETLPAEENGFVLHARTVRDAYLKLLWHVLTFGPRTGTQHSSDQRELLNVMTVISDEPADPAHFSHADWMPFSRQSLGERQPDGNFSGYLGQFVHAGLADAGVSYTYGDRLRAFDGSDSGGKIDQVAAIIADVQQSGHSRRAVATLWNPTQDALAPNPPCLNLVQVRLRPGKVGVPAQLHLTAYFRSHDIYRAWATNAYGLRALHSLIAEGLATQAPVVTADLVIISHSAHVYAHDWEAAQTLVAHHYRPTTPRFTHDPRGSFVVLLEPPEIIVQHYTPAGEHIQTLRGSNARSLGARLIPYLSDVNHAIYLGQELQKAELALRLGLPEAYHQDRELDL